jgi:hypothetical protein
MLNGLSEGHCTDLRLVYPKALGGCGGQGDRIGQLDEGAVIRERYEAIFRCSQNCKMHAPDVGVQFSRGADP